MVDETRLLGDKVAIVTGASSGIGKATARALGERGYGVALAARNDQVLAGLASEIGDHALAVPTDVSNVDAVEAMVEATVARFGRLDILVANAGVYSTTPFAEIDFETIDRLIDVNVRGVMHCARAALPHLRESGRGDILVVGSIAGIAALPDEVVYSPTKFALRSFVQILRRQLRGDNIRVGLISPGTVATELWGVATAEEVQARVDRLEALRAEDIAECALFMLGRPRHVAIRDVVILPHGDDL